MTNWINKGSKPTRTGFGEGVKYAADKNDKIIGLGADITMSVGLHFFAEAYPERFFSLGIAEQNAIGVAAGLALSEKIPVFSTYGVFAAHRAADQLRISLCYNNLHVIIGGAHAGISVGPDGATHQALEDVASLRAMPNMTILSPCDATQAFIAVQKAVEELNNPVYIRFGREAVADFTDENQHFDIGKAQLMRDGDELCIIATGHLVWEAIQAAEILARKGIEIAVLNMHTLKPIDKDAIIEAAKKFGKIVTAEEHQVTGGLGSAVAEVLSENYPVQMLRIGMQDRFGESGTAEELMAKYQLDADGIAKQINHWIRD
ncbi:MAG: transketolase C-terminal domain-containing protein [Bacteroidales bacterium]|nr:transketolase C-terminal domain-containing protein [Bacteroidales bacterium]HOI33136.1 transketolase C-terminal domain-containing protein [Bacteroidales bacterium]